jgi:hypothetical protein
VRARACVCVCVCSRWLTSFWRTYACVRFIVPLTPPPPTPPSIPSAVYFTLLALLPYGPAAFALIPLAGLGNVSTQRCAHFTAPTHPHARQWGCASPQLRCTPMQPPYLPALT